MSEQLKYFKQQHKMNLEYETSGLVVLVNNVLSKYKDKYEYIKLYSVTPYEFCLGVIYNDTHNCCYIDKNRISLQKQNKQLEVLCKKLHKCIFN